MNARIIKETRSLLPVFGVMLLAAVVPPLIWKRDTASGIGFMVFLACSAMLGACSLGNEFQWRTLPLLLAQPVPRRRLWLEKMLVLGSAVAIGYLVFLACTYVPDPGDDGVSRWALGLIPLGVLCSAPYLTLAVKNTIGAAAATVFLPISGWGLLAALEQGLAHFFPQAGELFDKSLNRHPFAYPAVYAVIYCAVFGWLGYRKFMGLQVVESQAQDIGLPLRMETALARPLRRLVPGYTGPWASLFRKELQLQRISFIIAGLMVALTPLELLAWKLFHSDITAGALGIMSLVMCIFVIPLVATGMSVAEERNWGVAGWQFIQPVSARKQWVAKMLVALFICATLGILLPTAGVAVAEGLFGFEGPRPHLPTGSTPMGTTFLLLGLLMIYLILLSLGVFASSVSRTTFQAVIKMMGMILLGIAGAQLIIYVGQDIVLYYTDRNPDPQFSQITDPNQRDQVMGQIRHAIAMAQTCLIAATGILLVLLLGLLQFLAYTNFRKGEQAAHRGWIKCGMILIILGGFAAVFINVFVGVLYFLSRQYLKIHF